jgi:AraC-like DNA-binding protein
VDRSVRLSTPVRRHPPGRSASSAANPLAPGGTDLSSARRITAEPCSTNSDIGAAILDGAPEADRLPAPAALLNVSPYRLSRAFSRYRGLSLTRYRNRVRVGRALDRLIDGDTGLADLAAHLGFADQAHLTRTVRAHAGHTPVALRRSHYETTFVSSLRDGGL